MLLPDCGMHSFQNCNHFSLNTGVKTVLKLVMMFNLYCSVIFKQNSSPILMFLNHAIDFNEP